ncbi:MAG: ABC transporter ATP-binding protein [Spirochaetaceae bacterium]|nr:ABC transporter ATP-binding protein [Spirochaetaceae bacterium]
MEKQLEIHRLTHRFGGLQALTNIELSLSKGTISGLIGPNGAGKTTLFNIVSGFYVPSEGDIIINGVRINGLKPHGIAALKVGRTFQNIRLWNDMTVLDNIMVSQYHRLGYNTADVFFRTKRYRDREAVLKKTAWELLDIFKLTNIAAEFPKNIPYGTQRRVEIARALSLEPELLMLDEPAAGFSTADTIELIEYIRWLHERFNLTIWMIEHQMDVIMSLCESITVIDFGKEIAAGTPDEIKNNPDVIRAYLGNGDLE